MLHVVIVDVCLVKFESTVETIFFLGLYFCRKISKCVILIHIDLYFAYSHRRGFGIAFCPGNRFGWFVVVYIECIKSFWLAETQTDFEERLVASIRTQKSQQRCTVSDLKGRYCWDAFANKKTTDATALCQTVDPRPMRVRSYRGSACPWVSPAKPLGSPLQLGAYVFLVISGVPFPAIDGSWFEDLMFWYVCNAQTSDHNPFFAAQKGHGTHISWTLHKNIR